MAVDICYFIKLGLFLVKKHNQTKYAITQLYYIQIRCIALRVCKLRMGFSVPSII